MAPPRSHFIDYDARRTPKTEWYCCACQKDLDPTGTHRSVYVDWGMNAIHPEDLATRGVLPNDHGWSLIGQDCAKKLGLAFTAPAERAETALQERAAALGRRPTP